MQVHAQEEIIIPEISENTEIDLVNDLPRLDILWKYETSMSFIKSILRKYSCEFRPLIDNVKTNLESACIHEQTKTRLLTWIDEVNSI